MRAAYGSVVEEGYDEDDRVAAWKALTAEVDATYLVLSTMEHRTVSFCHWGVTVAKRQLRRQDHPDGRR